jgi:hypothetical protein
MASPAKIDRRVMRGRNRAVVLDLRRRSGTTALVGEGMVAAT